MGSYSEITISIPAFNDENSLATLLMETKIVLEKLSLTPAFYIIDDGSSDNTFSVAKKFEQENSEKYFIEVARNKKNEGFGYTLNKVFTSPKTEWILFLPGDNQFPAENIPLLLNRIDKSKFIIGWRKERYDDSYRKTLSIAYNCIISFITNKKVHDVNSIVLFKKELLDGVLLKSKSAFIHAELFIKCGAKYGYEEIGIIHESRKYGNAGGAKIGVVLGTLFDCLKFVLLKF
jgi:undecaprenyl-phosphate 4-deoxy-4-formamido-L-arabinose transferase